MPIPESQLDIWAHQGSVTQSSNTYNTVKSVLESSDAPYAKREFTVFLQGSYGNNTNIYAESDVDIVIQLTSVFSFHLGALPIEQQSIFYQANSCWVAYNLADFKREVLLHLQRKYGDAVQISDKAIKIKANGSRRNVDVIVCMSFRNYQRFASVSDQQYVEGICFFNSSNIQIANYPKNHLANLTVKHQRTNGWYKPMVRIFKNIRTSLVQQGMIVASDAPSYFLEGMLYNVPDMSFGGSYTNTAINSINWLCQTDRSRLVCANEQYFLLNDFLPVTWRAAKFTAFLGAACDLWQRW